MGQGDEPRSLRPRLIESSFGDRFTPEPVTRPNWLADLPRLDRRPGWLRASLLELDEDPPSDRSARSAGRPRVAAGPLLAVGSRKPISRSDRAHPPWLARAPRCGATHAPRSGVLTRCPPVIPLDRCRHAYPLIPPGPDRCSFSRWCSMHNPTEQILHVATAGTDSRAREQT